MSPIIRDGEILKEVQNNFVMQSDQGHDSINREIPAKLELEQWTSQMQQPNRAIRKEKSC